MKLINPLETESEPSSSSEPSESSKSIEEVKPPIIIASPVIEPIKKALPPIIKP